MSGAAKRHSFRNGRRYRLTILPAGARTKTLTFEGNYLGTGFAGEYVFDGRPQMGTQYIHGDSIQGEPVDIGPSTQEQVRSSTA